MVAVAGLGPALAMVGTAAAAGAPLPPGAQPAQTALYRCVSGTTIEIAILGLDLCDAEPTPLLAERAEPDNLQTRGGALAVEVEARGIAAAAGVQAGDMVYRVAGVDVTGATDAGSRLVTVGPDSDTQINFLRRGRPYRIKLRR
jgi:S1-C subfamily serine protease